MAKTEERIREFSGEVIGLVETDSETGDKIVRAYPGRQILGYYRKKYDHTTNFYGQVVAKGDAAVSLIYKNRGK